MNRLDTIPSIGNWYFCIPLFVAVYCITILGIIHPLFWINVIRVYTSELFTFMYVLVFFWSLLSGLLLYAIIAGSHCIYSFWIWYTMVFCSAMALMLLVLFVGFCVMTTRRRALITLIGIIYYSATFYSALVVNQHRKEVFGLNATCASFPLKHNMSVRMLMEDKWPAATIPNIKETTTTAPTTTETTTTAPTTTAPTTTETTTTVTTTVTTTATTTLSTTTQPTTTTTPQTSPTTTTLSTTSGPTSLTINPAMLAFFAGSYDDDNFMDNSLSGRRRQNPQRDDRAVDVYNPRTPVPRFAALAMLSDLLVNSTLCLKPRKPAHGKFHKRGRRGGPSFQLTLECKEGYQATTVTTKCMNNWWDNPIPQCRKRKPPDRKPPPGGGCVMPSYPSHGEYRVVEHPHARPDDVIVGDNIVLLVTCDRPYLAVDPYVLCVEGQWHHPPPRCLKRKPPDRKPPPGGGCVMPSYPSHGEYRVVEHPHARPDDVIVGDNNVLLVACDRPYLAVDPYAYLVVDPYILYVEGRRKHAPPSCLKHCELIFDRTVKYKCLDTFKDEFVGCKSLQPDGSVVVASCKPGYAHRGPYRYMRCRGDYWDHEVSCQHYTNFTS